MKLKRHIVFGIDAGFRHMGIAVMELRTHELVQTYVFSTKRSKTRYVAEDNRSVIEFLSDRLATIIGEYKPIYVVSELPTGASKSSRAANAMAFGFAVVVLTCKRLGVDLQMITPKELKQHVAPNRKKVPKEAVIAFIKRKYGASLLPTNMKCEHVADAIACIDTYLNQNESTTAN